jgi:SagB-type dehydrogenase family enzyme
VREYSHEPLTPKELSQLLWAAQGISSPDGKRTAPSAGAIYPLRLYVVVADVMSLSPGIYAYRPQTHALDNVAGGHVMSDVAAAAFGQTWMRTAPAVIVIAADDDMTTRKYGSRGKRFVHIEVGHAAQNVYLQATAFNLATVMVGAFDEAQVASILRLPQAEQPLALLPVGRPK